MEIKTKLYLEIEVDVIGNYFKGYTARNYDEPSEPHSFEIDKVLWNGYDITDALDTDKFDWNELEYQCLEIKNEQGI